ncbi:hypothetical protein [Paraburkholderia xenovorans]
MQRNVTTLLGGMGADNSDPLDAIWESIERDDGSAAAAHLAMGKPVYIVDESTPSDAITKLWPDGTREVVRFTLDGEQSVPIKSVHRNTKPAHDS